MSLIDKLVGLRQGSRGRAVRELQELIASLGYPIAVDGDYGPITAWHVNRICIDAGVPSLGGLVVTYESWLALGSTTQRNTGTPDPQAQHLEALLAFAYGTSPRVRDMLADPKNGAAYGVVMRALATLPLLRDACIAEGPFAAPAFVAEWLYARDIREEWGQNRGPWVDVLVEIGGGDHRDAPSWCAYFITACRRIAQWLWALEDPDMAARMVFPITGRAAALYQRAHAGSRMAWQPHNLARLRGAAMVRGRSSRPDTDRHIIQAGNQIGAHTAAVLGPGSGFGLIHVGGNSNGAGHDASGATSRAHARGRVALELLVDERGRNRNPKAYQAYLRCAGFAHLTPYGVTA